jgi:protein-tyrosine phosphatase
MEPIKLLQPAHHSTTPPFQEHPWPPQDAETQGQLPIDRSQPRPVEFHWERPAIEGNSLRYDLAISKSPEFHDPILIRNLSATSTQVWNLEIGTRYYWKVIARRHTQKLATSAVNEFTTHHQTPRWLYIPEITNVRDIGGWPLPDGRKIRQGMVYRSSEMNSHLELTAHGKDILINHLKICTDIDLRGEEEVRMPAVKEIRYINAPIQPYANILEEQYKPFYKLIFKTFADPSAYPIILHCWGGADRTGTVIYLLEALLGVDKQWLIQDYELTSLSIWGERKHTSVDFTLFLESLSQFGKNEQEKAEKYLVSIGITPDDISSIKKVLISPG